MVMVFEGLVGWVRRAGVLFWFGVMVVLFSLHTHRPRQNKTIPKTKHP
jgi:hypothetical protein